MQRHPIAPRPDLATRAREAGFDFATTDGAIYWDERAYYSFSLRQIEDHIEAPSAELSALCMELVSRAVGDERILARLSIPADVWDLIAESWRRGDPSLYGRLDLAYDGNGPAKLLEYNADTPTALFEAAAFQWGWLEDAMTQRLIPPQSDQFNSIHEVLITTLTGIAGYVGAKTLHLACDPNSSEDRGLIAYLAECADQAGIATAQLAIGDIGTRGKGPFLDLDGAAIEVLFKLYPWEWMFSDDFIRSPSMRQTRFIEPPWKAILSNKGILPLLWAIAPGHPNLLPSYFADDPASAALGGRFARKPLYSREGSNVTLIDGATLLEQAPGPYDDGDAVLQALASMPAFDGNTPVLGSWIVGGTACGLGIREDTSRITRNSSRFVPHAIIG